MSKVEGFEIGESLDLEIAVGDEAEAYSRCKVNAAAADTWQRFEEKLEKHLEAFYESHPYEKN